MAAHVLNETEFDTFFQLIDVISKAKGDYQYVRNDGYKYHAQVGRVVKYSGGAVYSLFFREKEGVSKSTNKLSERMFEEFESKFIRHVLSNDTIPQSKKEVIEKLFKKFSGYVKKSYEPSNSRKEKTVRKENLYNSLIRQDLSRLKDLVGLYKGNIYQGECVDDCQLILNTYEPNQVKGLMKVQYEHDQENPIPDASLDVQGDFSENIVLRLFYQNVKKESLQFGVFQLEYNSLQQLTGDFIAYYVPIPKNRTKTGTVFLKKLSNKPEFQPDQEEKE